MDKNLQDHGIELIYGATFEAILGNKKVEAVQTNSGKFATDMVIIKVGFKQIQFLVILSLNCSKMVHISS